jgi:hypothetical protein
MYGPAADGIGSAVYDRSFPFSVTVVLRSDPSVRTPLDMPGNCVSCFVHDIGSEKGDHSLDSRFVSSGLPSRRLFDANFGRPEP